VQIEQNRRYGHKNMPCTHLRMNGMQTAHRSDGRLKLPHYGCLRVLPMQNSPKVGGFPNLCF